MRSTDGGVSTPAWKPLRLPLTRHPPPHLRHSSKMERIKYYLNGGSLNARSLRECNRAPSARSRSQAVVPILR